MPPLTEAELAALREDIAANGVLVPITVDQHGRVIDGNNRAAIAAELGIECPRRQIEVADDDAAIDLALTLNCARRHLSREQVRALIQAEIQRRPDDSDRKIARRLGCSPTTVGTIRRAGDEVSNLDTEDEATVSAQITKDALEFARLSLALLAGEACDAAVPKAEIVMALTSAQRSHTRRASAEVAQVFADSVYGPVIDAVLVHEHPPENLNPDPEFRSFILQELADISRPASDEAEE